VCWVVLNHPYLEEVIMDFFYSHFIGIIIYGDDHICCAPKILHGVMNVNIWADFLKNYCRSVLRDYREYDSFLTIPNLWTGEIKIAGPKFCKRYFIANIDDKTLPPVLPYKPLYEPMLRVFVNANQEPIDYLLSIVGHMWDTMGTNKTHYILLKQFYDSINSDLKVQNIYELYMEEFQKIDKRPKLNRLIRKINLSPEEIFKSVPTFEQIRKRNIYEPHKCKFGIDTYNPNDLDLLEIEIDDLEFI